MNLTFDPRTCEIFIIELLFVFTVDEDDDSDDEGSISSAEFDQNAKECGTAMRESRAYEAMSSLVNYIQPVRYVKS